VTDDHTGKPNSLFDESVRATPSRRGATSNATIAAPVAAPIQERDSWLNRSALIVWIVIEAGALWWYVALGRHEWFSGDEWDFLSARSARSIHDLLAPHNEHWSTLPILVYRGLWWAFGLHTYIPFLALVVALHLTAATLLLRVMLRAAVAPWIATVAATSFALFGSGNTDILYGFQIGFDGSLVFGLAQLLASDHSGDLDRRDWIGLVCGFAGLMCSGVAVSMTIAVGVAVFIRRGWRLALFHVAPLGAAYVVWFALIGRSGYSKHATPWAAITLARHYVWATFVAIGQSRLAGVAFAATALVATGLICTQRGARSRRVGLPVALVAGGLAFLLIAGAGRPEITTGIFAHGGYASRYLHITAAFLITPLAVAADILVRRWRPLIAVVVPLFLVGIPGNLHETIDQTNRARADSTERQRVLTLARLPILPAISARTLVDPPFDPWMTSDWLMDGVQSGRIPRVRKVSPAEVASLTLVLALRQLASTVGLTTCRASTPGQTLALRVNDVLVMSGSARLIYLPPRGPAAPPVAVGPIEPDRRFIVAVPSLEVRFQKPDRAARLRVCRTMGRP
jgi:hypothetical protein